VEDRGQGELRTREADDVTEHDRAPRR
jgi:hypothetical protein